MSRAPAPGTPEAPRPGPGTSPEPFGARLRRALDTRGPLCVGIDPHPALLGAWGLGDDLAGLERFTRATVDALADRVAVLKPQAAFFERFGSRGLAVLEHAIADARSAGALVVTDAKRGDIGSTMAAYADTFLRKGSPLFSDAVTVSPYLGFGSLRPALDRARENGCGVFVLALTSNPEGAEVQRATAADGRSVAQAVLDRVAAENAAAAGDTAVPGATGATGATGHPAGPLGSVGAVVGATLRETGVRLPAGAPLLAPGIGAQGAAPADLPALFGDAVRNVVPSVSRGVLRHGPDPAGLRAAAERLTDEVRAVAAA
ncbi:orotidine-5'-phosphate decarboxylase [Streptomyces zingiberis]|uniref:Orotidine 5'-phosphate decarboxylase n=1 Tax=Streptomyces zingiberis TaxID=2053010 RepID=A0ABX1BV38_9ACTN|nr:orotidine-5'-phosphate decarboxylase [Streptomyces zingiberis]NJQ01536.1 orotidine-5'-phosphate decarboxylase [Streptomyces zingiberis]